MEGFSFEVNSAQEEKNVYFCFRNLNKDVSAETKDRKEEMSKVELALSYSWPQQQVNRGITKPRKTILQPLSVCPIWHDNLSLCVCLVSVAGS